MLKGDILIRDFGFEFIPDLGNMFFLLGGQLLLFFFSGTSLSDFSILISHALFKPDILFLHLFEVIIDEPPKPNKPKDEDFPVCRR